ncbi:MAG: SDR family NAD(P)-dependent oxidoreductase [Rickettsiales bacterium TMED289]|nr:MAG: SDR family NAD(P)-dependent oxidoreductase [Rickettsiales bacterium TMED289]|tara:strand:+ start:3405 stop:4382 length:978 start_codon:yes stop_codon:yes gene_type:complete
MKVLVTGADGFIGSHLVEMLMEKGFQVNALAQYNSFNSWGWLEDVKNKKDMKIITGDIRDPFFCNKITKDIDAIFHLAALIAIPYSYSSPDSYLDTNVKGTLNICQSAIKNNVGRVLITSTSEVYGTALYTPIDEKHPLQAQSPYSASKIASEAIAMSFFNSFDLPLTIVRPFNTYGPRQSARAVIPSIVSQILQGHKEIKIGDTSPTRDFSFVEDTCRGFIEIVNNKNTNGEIVNIGSNFEISILEIINKIKKILDSDVKIIEEKSRLRPKNSEVYRLWCDNSKIKKLTGFEPKIDIDLGLRKTIDWIKVSDNLSKYKTDIYNV